MLDELGSSNETKLPQRWQMEAAVIGTFCGWRLFTLPVVILCFLTAEHRWNLLSAFCFLLSAVRFQKAESRKQIPTVSTATDRQNPKRISAKIVGICFLLSAFCFLLSAFCFLPSGSRKQKAESRIQNPWLLKTSSRGTSLCSATNCELFLFSSERSQVLC